MVSAVDETGVTSTLAGLCKMVPDNFAISVGIVAEKKRVCFFAGSLVIIFFTS